MLTESWDGKGILRASIVGANLGFLVMVLMWIITEQI